MGFDDLANKAKDALNSDKGEDITDSGLDKAADFVDDKTGGKFSDQISKGRDAADGQVGNE